MSRVKVTFYMEASDPSHSTGLTNEDFEMVIAELSPLSDGDECVFELVEDDREPDLHERQAKPLRSK